MSDSFYNPIRSAEQASTPPTPGGGFQLSYPKADGKWYVLNSAGVESPVVQGLATTALAGLVGTGAQSFAGFKTFDVGYQGTQTPIFNIVSNYQGWGITNKFLMFSDGNFQFNSYSGYTLMHSDAANARVHVQGQLVTGSILNSSSIGTGSVTGSAWGGNLISFNTAWTMYYQASGDGGNNLVGHQFGVQSPMSGAGSYLAGFSNGSGNVVLIGKTGDIQFGGALRPGGDIGANGMIMKSNGSISYWGYGTGGWNFNGNTGTVDADFVGTSDNRRLLIKSNSVDRILISSDGNFTFNNEGLNRFMSFEAGGLITWRVASTPGQTSQFLCGGSTYPNWGLYYSGGYNNSILGGIYNTSGLKLGGTNTAKVNILNTGMVIGTGTDLDSIAATAALDIKSTTQGALLPRMTTTQRNAISSPANALMVYDTTLNKLFIYESSTWKQITTT